MRATICLKRVCVKPSTSASPAGRAVLPRLVERADVFVTNTPLPSRAHLGIRWEDLAPLNPRRIYASITAYGERGDEAPRCGHRVRQDHDGHPAPAARPRSARSLPQRVARTPGR
ncbi:MAG: CoA transferase [candidate division NC10 bacterium]